MSTIIAETTGSNLHPVTAQLVSASNGDVIICPGGVGASDAANIAGVSKVITVEGDCFSSFDGAAWAAAMSGLTSDGRVILAATPRGRELAAHIAASRNIPVIQDVTGGSPSLIMHRPVYSGKAIEHVKCEGDCVVTIRPNSWPAAADGGNAEQSTVNQSADVTVAVKEAIAKASERLDVSDADIIISGGRGMGSIDNWNELEKIADQLGAAVGASRAVVDEWGLSHSIQVGQTGKVVNPSLYIAVGISGAIQHLAGMRSSKYIVAINKDADAPIFSVADYGIVATWEDALPALAEALSNL
ncbi:MAG: electron transfer flavoprotein subunit alpha/FixB family protein [Candidatus Thalassarchaeaceae archaeon]|jgi:electron transfer flavoprotein alpha subunit|nr:electron transfer flavoprotein subunit alpha/FixB family protein [Candidatus Thalassarchaeaceae archaeon]